MYMFKKTILRILAAAAFIAIAGCASDKLYTDESVQAVETFMRSYRSSGAEAASINRFIKLINTMSSNISEEAMAPMPQMPVVSFLCHVFRDNPQRIKEYFATTQELDEAPARDLLALAFYLSATKEGDGAFVKLRGESPRASFLRSLGYPPPQFDATIEGDIFAVAQLDYCWGAYLATGNEGYALRVFEVAVKDEPQEEEDEERLSAFRSLLANAKWSLVAFMRTDKRVKEAVNDALKISPDYIKNRFTADLSEETKKEIVGS